jgi:hypothetical protein
MRGIPGRRAHRNCLECAIVNEFSEASWVIEGLGRERVKRLDETFPVFLSLISILFGVVRDSPGLRQLSSLFLISLVAFSMLAWGIGHVRGDDPVSVFFKLSGWLAWVNQVGILVIFSAWIDYLHLLAAWTGIIEWVWLVRLLTAVALVLATILAWFVMTSLYQRQRSECHGPLVAGLLISFLIAGLLIY